MMSEQVLMAAAMLAGLVVLTLAMLKGWQGWLTLKERELDLMRTAAHAEPGSRDGMQRIEIADLKERIRKLEAIASGVDL